MMKQTVLRDESRGEIRECISRLETIETDSKLLSNLEMILINAYEEYNSGSVEDALENFRNARSTAFSLVRSGVCTDSDEEIILSEIIPLIEECIEILDGD